MALKEKRKMNDCIFCKIVKGDIPCYKIYEDEHTLAFLDIANDAYGHTLVIPKQHFVNHLDCDTQVLTHVISTVQKIIKHYVNDCGFEGANVLNANQEVSGQSVFHLHYHVIPRKKGDGICGFPELKKQNFDLAKIKEELAF